MSETTDAVKARTKDIGRKFNPSKMLMFEGFNLFLVDVDRFVSKDFSEHDTTFWNEIIRTRQNGSAMVKTSLPVLLMLFINSSPLIWFF